MQVPVLGQENVGRVQAALDRARRRKRLRHVVERREHVVGLGLRHLAAALSDDGPDDGLQPPDHREEVRDPVAHRQAREAAHVQHQHRARAAEAPPDLAVDLGQRFRVLVARVEQPRKLRLVVAHVPPGYMYSGGVNGRARGRAGRGVWLFAAILCALAGADARAEKKKEPGFFDMKSWIPGSHERDEVRRLTPEGVNLTPAVAPTGQNRVIRTRFYADRDYRGTVIRWQAKARAQIQRVNAAVGAVFNVRFEIESLRDWDRTHAGVPLGEPLIDELEKLDDGQQVDLVIGLVTPMHGVATSADIVGWARFWSRHFVRRGMDDEEEYRIFEREFTLVTAEQRQRLYADRKAHKEIVVFLHEWGHTLGLLHHEDSKCIMNPGYHHEA